MNQVSVAPSILTSQSLGLPSLIVVESTATLEKAEARVRRDLASCMKASDAASALDFLGKGMSVLYIERGEKLDSSVETLVTSYSAGIASFATPNGLLSASFDPLRAMFTVVLSRTALENSYPELLTYVGAVASIS